MGASAEEVAKWRAEFCGDHEAQTAAQYGFSTTIKTTVVINGKREKSFRTMTVGEFYDALGQAMRERDPLLGAERELP